ncbi:chloroquine resistance marker protein [Cryptosporidium felis]|nr:chloroquine resistance marker protein [Cryptosporidium felis]
MQLRSSFKEINKRSLSLDSPQRIKENIQKWKFDRNWKILTTSEEKRIHNSDEHEKRTQERLKRLSLSLQPRRKDSIKEYLPSQSNYQMNKILLYINTGASYNNYIYKRREEYKKMIQDIFFVGGHCCEVMIGSFNNIVNNPKVNGVSMTRMDRLLNFLSFVQDLHRNYCDPAINIVAPSYRPQNEYRSPLNKSSISSSRSDSCIYCVDDEVERTKKPDFKYLESSARVKTQNLTSSDLLERFRLNRENNFLKPSEKIQMARDTERSSFFGKVTYKCSQEPKLKPLPLRHEYKDLTVKEIFESLREFRKGTSSAACRPSSSINYPEFLNASSRKEMRRSKSEIPFKLDDIPSRIQKSKDKRIKNLQVLISKLKEIKLGSNNLNFMVKNNIGRGSKGLEDRGFHQTKEGGESSSNSSLEHMEKPVSQFQTWSEFEVCKDDNTENISQECPNKTPSQTEHVKSRWELDTPFVNYRRIQHNSFDQNFIYESDRFKSMQEVLPLNCGKVGSKEGVLVSGLKERDIDGNCETDGVLEKTSSEPVSISGINKEQAESPIQTLPDPIEGQDMDSSKNLTDENMPTKPNSHLVPRVKKTLPIQEAALQCKATPGDEGVNNNLKSEKTPVQKESFEWTLDDGFGNTSENRSEREGPLFEHVMILEDEKNATDEINEITSKLEDITFVNEDLINKIKDLPIEEIHIPEKEGLSTIGIYNPGSKVPSLKNGDTLAMDRKLQHIEYFISAEDELKSKIEEYNHWFESAALGKYYELNLDGLNLDEFYFKNIDSVPKSREEPIDISPCSIYNICKIIFNNFPKITSELRGLADSEPKMVGETVLKDLELFVTHEINGEDLLAFIHDQVMKDPDYLGFRSSIRKELNPPDDNFILLVIDLIRELLQEWKSDPYDPLRATVTLESISKQVTNILSRTYEPYLSKINPEEWVLKRIFHAPHYPNILESEKEFLNIEHLFKYHHCEDSITSEFINMDRKKWLQTSNYYVPLLDEVVERILNEEIDHAILNTEIYRQFSCTAQPRGQ